MPPAKNPYEVLRLSPTASQQDIDAAYRRLKGLLADDALASYGMMDPEQAAALAQELDAAYRVIGEANDRDAFDQRQHPWAIEAALGHDVSSSPHPQATPRPSPGRDARTVERPPHAETAGAQSLPPPAPRPSTASWSVPAEALPDATATLDGAMLQRLRLAASASLDDVSHVTKINRRYLAALENDDFAQLPTGVYIRGFVGEYLRALGLSNREGVDTRALLTSFIERYQSWRRAPS